MNKRPLPSKRFDRKGKSREKQTMRIEPTKILFWTPRVFGVLFCLFISLFALDVFGEEAGFGAVLLAFVIHLVPTYIVVIALVIAWKRELIGAIVFACLSIGFMFVSRGSGWVIAAPLMLLSVLFFVDWTGRARFASN